MVFTQWHNFAVYLSRSSSRKAEFLNVQHDLGEKVSSIPTGAITRWFSQFQTAKAILSHFPGVYWYILSTEDEAVVQYQNLLTNTQYIRLFCLTMLCKPLFYFTKFLQEKDLNFISYARYYAATKKKLKCQSQLEDVFFSAKESMRSLGLLPDLSPLLESLLKTEVKLLSQRLLTEFRTLFENDPDERAIRHLSPFKVIRPGRTIKTTAAFFHISSLLLPTKDHMALQRPETISNLEAHFRSVITQFSPTDSFSIPP
ncbi:hypothetical protein BLNAU_17624 [Blattamonas nauphoetae]|uniref:Uncharacterized protein n=1 Tax=Blattamonas nauphoetae TaxID=2049346 RepID=A0ABQ9X6S7_9EUKA|nr:hypothetical protein BLNAU_17624 [Blattamonas nauphoetae]